MCTSPVRRLRNVASILAFTIFVSSSSHAQKLVVQPDGLTVTAPPSAPIAQPQYAAITAANNEIQLSRLPVTFNGNVFYADVTLAVQLGVNPDGTLSVDLTPTVIGSPNLLVNNFAPGTYVGPSNVNGGKNIIVVSGPSPLAGGGTAWTLSAGTTASTATYPSEATWYVESIANNPLATRIMNAKITATAYAYGEGDSGSAPNYSWGANSLLGFIQVGNTLSISNFTNIYSGDQSTPVDTITYTLQPPPAQ